MSEKLRPFCLGLNVLSTDTANTVYAVSVAKSGVKKYHTSNGSWCMGIKGEMSGTVCVTFTWDMYIYMSCL